MGRTEKAAIAAILLSLTLLFVSFFGLPTPNQTGFAVLPQNNTADAIIYKNEACGHCSMYLGNLKQFFDEKGISYIEKSVINDEAARLELLEFNTRKNISPELQGHMTIVLKDKLILQGHVPTKLVREVIESNSENQMPEMILFQDLMVDEIEIDSYTVRDSTGNVYNCSPTSTAAECLKQQNGNSQQENSIFQWLPFIIIISGILAGIHPCTIGVLLFFMSFLFTIHKTRLNVLKIGGAYIAGVFLAYFLIGLGLLKAVAFAEPHFAAKIAAYLVIVLGLFNIARYFFPKIRGFGIPEQSKEFIAGAVEKGSVPGAVVVGLFVGVCSFGCTAGIYFSILGMLITQPTFGVLYLLLYNLMFILPLIAILLLATNDKVVEKISRLEVTKTRLITLIAGLLMVVLGIVILLFIAGGM